MKVSQVQQQPKSPTDTVFTIQGSNVMVQKRMDLGMPEIHEMLPPGNYTVGFSDKIGFYLQRVEPFKQNVLYGDAASVRDRIVNTFLSRPNNTGVMLTGEKGCGKTMLARILSMKLKEDYGIPTIIINTPYYGEGFNKFLSSIQQPLCILFDEFEKTYRNKEDRDNEAQESILTLFDGVFQQKRMFVITCNDKYALNKNMINRPGRFFYSLDYSGLNSEFIFDYCKINLKNTDHTESVCRVASLFDKFNFDMLQAIVEEMNRYNEPASVAIRMLNAKPTSGTAFVCHVELYKNEVRVPEEMMVGSAYASIVPTSSSFRVRTKKTASISTSPIAKEETDKVDQKIILDNIIGVQKSSKEVAIADDVMFTVSDMVEMNGREGKFIYQKGNMKAVLTKCVHKEYEYSHID